MHQICCRFSRGVYNAWKLRTLPRAIFSSHHERDQEYRHDNTRRKMAPLEYDITACRSTVD